MTGGAGRGERFLPLPVLVSVLFFALAVGSQYNPGSAVVSPDGTYRSGPLPNAAQAWTWMQTRPANDWEEITVLDTLASISPLPGSGVEEVTVFFMSMQGFPFQMPYYSVLEEYYGDLHAGARVLAYFLYSGGREEWVLLYIVNAERAWDEQY